MARERKRQFGKLLMARFLAVNLLGLLLVAVAWRQGLVAEVWAADSSRLTLAIGVAFLWALAAGAWRAWKLTRELDRVAAGAQGEKGADYAASLERGVAPGVAAEALRAKLVERIGFLRHASGALVSLGLIGTVIGFIIALSGVDPARVGEASAIAPMVAKLIEGMGVALYTTLVGAALGIWTALNHRILATGAANLYAAILESVPCSMRTRESSFAM